MAPKQTATGANDSIGVLFQAEKEASLIVDKARKCASLWACCFATPPLTLTSAGCIGLSPHCHAQVAIFTQLSDAAPPQPDPDQKR